MPKDKHRVVLLTEDKKDVRKNIQGVLENHDYVVVGAEDGQVALEVLKHEDSDLVLVDLRLPETSSMDVLAQIRQQSPDTPIVVITGTGQTEKAVQALNLGAWDYALDPVAHRALFLHTVEKALVHGRLIRENRDCQRSTRESEERYRLIVENSISPITYFSADGHILMINNVAAKNLGGKPEDFIGKTTFDIFSNDQAGQLIHKVKQHLDSDLGHEYEYKYRLAGRDHWFQTQLQPMRDAKGNITAYQSIASDITELKETEAALRESEEKYRLVLDNALTHMFYLSVDGQILMLNAIAAQAMGGKPEDLIGRSVFEFVPPENQGYLKDMLRRIIESKDSALTYEFKAEHAGNTVWILIQNRTVRDAGGNVIGIQAVCADISELKSAQEELRKHRDHLEELVVERTQELRSSNEELRQLRNLLANIVDSMPSVLVGVDLEGRVIQWNREACQETGIPADKAMGCKMEEVFPRLSGEMEKVREAMRDRIPKKDTKVLWKTDGETRYLSVTIFPLITNGIEGAVIRVDDVTERVRIEEMMIQSEKMLTVGGLAAGMAHEINNPLAAIIQNLQVMRNRISDSLDKNRSVAEECGTDIEAISAYMDRRGISSMIESMMEAGRRAAKIVENMLNFSRKSMMQFAPHDLRKLVEDVVDLASKDYNLKKKYDFRDIEIVREYDPATLDVPCEASEIQQVLMNILRNGAEAMSESRDAGKGPRFILRIMPDGDMARIEIEDNGPGMDEAIRRRVFEPFFTTKAVGVGTGLGLSVSYFIISDNHRGTITVESVKGGGTTFIIRLPLQRKDVTVHGFPPIRSGDL